MNHLRLYLILLVGGMSASLLSSVLGFLSWRGKTNSSPHGDLKKRLSRAKRMIKNGASADQVIQKTELSISEVDLVSKLLQTKQD